METIRKIFSILFSFLLLTIVSCRGDKRVIPISEEKIDGSIATKYAGLYLLNEGNMGSNKATLDYLDFSTMSYFRNIYPSRNPDVALELGDVGNDILLYGSKLYLAINASNKVEVLDARSAKRLGQIDIPNCRSLLGYGGKLYVSSYVAPIKIDPKAPRGALYRIDTASLQIFDFVEVGYQPEELATDGKSIFVANSGGYRSPNYDNTISVVDINSFKEVEKIPVAINLHHLKIDHYDQLWVNSRGNYRDIPSCLVLLQRNQKKRFEPRDTLNIPCSGFDIAGDSLFYYASEWNNQTQKTKVSYGIVNIKRPKDIHSFSLIKPHPKVKIKTPYGIAVNTSMDALFIMDAKEYTSSGELYCFTKKGEYQWKVTTGDIPGHIVFLPK